MTDDTRWIVARAIRRTAWVSWSRFVPEGDETLASLSDAAVAGYLAQADAVLAALHAGGAVVLSAEEAATAGSACAIAAEAAHEPEEITEYRRLSMKLVNKA